MRCTLALSMAALLGAPVASLAGGSPAAAPLMARQPFARAHVQLVARVEPREGQARMGDVELWAEGTRLRAVLHDATAAEIWVDGLDSEPVVVVAGKTVEPRRRSLEQALRLALRPAPSLSNSRNDRVAGHPCRVITEELRSGVSMTRCIWRGLPLSVEISGRGYSFNAAATLVEEGAIGVADLQPPSGAPAAPPSLSATR